MWRYTELRTALHKAGKIGVTHEKVGRVLTKYDADGSGTLEFDEFQTMVKDCKLDTHSKNRHRVTSTV